MARVEELLAVAKWAVYALEHGSSIEVQWLTTVAKEKHKWAKDIIADYENIESREQSVLEKELRGGAFELIKLADDLKTGKAKEVPPEFGHVYRHFWNEQPVAPVYNENLGYVPMIQRTECVDFLKLWGVWFYIATCPRTGIRFVEGVKR